ncbi:MAG TPA: hypothetical protein VM680_02320 [Verrucomicrobiae bacterium]|nr:hypothetical protein [Verrucomicrobiae bacterium]
MRGSFNRRTATKVKDGRVQRKNRRPFTTHQQLVIDRESPGRLRRHVVTKRDILAFIDLIPDWERLSVRLERIVLTSDDSGLDGYHDFYHREETGGIFLNAWDEELWASVSEKDFLDHEQVFLRLGVAYDRRKGEVLCQFTEAQARAFTLLHVFMHELGHHFDRVNQKHRDGWRGEEYAERFALERFDGMYSEYVRVFGDPARS